MREAARSRKDVTNLVRARVKVRAKDVVVDGAVVATVTLQLERALGYRGADEALVSIARLIADRLVELELARASL